MRCRKGLRAVALLLTMGLVILYDPLSAAPQRDSQNSTAKPSLSVDEIVRRVEKRNHERAEALRKFQGTRVYRMQYRGFFGTRDAAMTVRLDYTSPDDKVFTIVSSHGSKFVIDHVFKGLLDGEKEAAAGENQRRTALGSDNYNFTLAGFEPNSDAGQYVLDVVPKTSNKYLYRGKVWIDAKDFAVARVEAEPSKNPSFWIKKSEIHQRFQKLGDFWLAEENRTESSIRLGGRAVLVIEYKDYEIKDPPLSASAQSARAGTVSSASAADGDFAAKAQE